MPPLPKTIILRRIAERSAAREAAAAATPIAEKVNHVRRATQTRPHHCHGRMPGCRGECPPAMWGCLPCWRKLPKRLRDAIWAAYRPGQEDNMTPSPKYLEVARETQEWIALNYPRPDDGGGTDGDG